MYNEMKIEGCFNNLIQKLLIDYESNFKAHFKVSYELFKILY